MNSDTIILNQFLREHSKDAALALEELDPDIVAVFFNGTSMDLVQKVIPYMSLQLMTAVYERMSQEKLLQLFESMEIHHAVLSLRVLKEDLADSVLNGLSGAKSASIKTLFQYIESSVGSHMDPAVFTLEENLTVKEALSEMRKHKKQIPPQLFVLSSERKLVGVLPLSELIMGSPGKGIKNLMSTRITTFSPETPVQSILNHPDWADYYAMPIVDSDSYFLGAIKLESIRTILVQSSNRVEETGQAAMNALGELYRIGVAGILRSAADLKSLSKE